jgi:4-hydroxythreonine-4-phosphate dehydrogenase
MPAPLLLTQGDPSGIGPELTLKAWLSRKETGVAPFLWLASSELAERTARRLGLAVPIAEAMPATACAMFDGALPVLPIGEALGDIASGVPDPATAASTMGSIRRAVELVHEGAGRAVVTNPIAKSVLYAAGFRHPGHTEFLGELSRELWGDVRPPVMMLWCETLAVVPVTIHVALRAVPELLTTDLIVETGVTVAGALRSRFRVAAPRLALAGLNPHAGEDGAMGDEDARIVRPAVEALRAQGIDAVGPLPADTMFHARARARYDVALCMYHDQALIPIKTLAFDEGVNVTLGLPFVRTSPDHGTAFDIAGRGVARPDSLIAALRLADRLSGADGP